MVQHQLDIDSIMDLMREYTPKKDVDGELDEQDAAPAGGADSGVMPRAGF